MGVGKCWCVCAFVYIKGFAVSLQYSRLLFPCLQEVDLLESDSGASASETDDPEAEWEGGYDPVLDALDAQDEGKDAAGSKGKKGDRGGARGGSEKRAGGAGKGREVGMSENESLSESGSENEGGSGGESEGDSEGGSASSDDPFAMLGVGDEGDSEGEGQEGGSEEDGEGDRHARFMADVVGAGGGGAGESAGAGADGNTGAGVQRGGKREGRVRNEAVPEGEFNAAAVGDAGGELTVRRVGWRVGCWGTVQCGAVGAARCVESTGEGMKGIAWRGVARAFIALYYKTPLTPHFPNITPHHTTHLSPRSDLLNALGDQSATLGRARKDLERLERRASALDAPLPRVAKERMERQEAYKKSKEQVMGWRGGCD